MNERNHSAVDLAARSSDMDGIELVSDDAAGLGDRPAANGSRDAVAGADDDRVEVRTAAAGAVGEIDVDLAAAADASYQRRLGGRLREIRRAQGLRLQDVEQRSDGRFKAVVIGSYERGDRAVSAHKLASLASFYGVPVSDLLPDDDWPRRSLAEPAVRIAVDRLRSGAEADPTLAPLGRLVQHVQWLRGDYNGSVLSLRGDDLRTVAVALGVDAGGLEGWLSERDLLSATG